MSDTRFRSSFPQGQDGQGFRTSAWYGIAPRPSAVPSLRVRTWTEALHAAAREDSRAGITWLGEAEELTQSYAVIEARSLAVAVGLQERGVQPGEAVMIVAPSPLEFLAVLFGVVRLGAVPVLVEPPSLTHTEDELVEVLADAATRSGATFLVTTKAVRTRLVRLAVRVPALARMTTAESLIETSVSSSARAMLPEEPRAEQTIYVQYAHDGGPHGVEMSHASVLGNVHALGQAAQISRADRLLSLAPSHRDMGLVGALLFGIYWCVPVTVLAPRLFVRDPALWLRRIERDRITIAPASRHAFALCTPLAGSEPFELSSLRLMPCACDADEAAAAEAFAAAFAPAGLRSEALWPMYGVAEASLTIAAPPAGSGLQCASYDAASLAAGRVVPARGEAKAVRLPSVGRALHGHRLLVADADGDELDDGHVGHLVLAGPSLMKGYWNEPAAAFDRLQEGWLWTGDLGFVGAHGLVVTGRAHNVLQVQGKNHYVEELERELEELAGRGQDARRALLFQVPGVEGEVLIAVVEVRAGAEPSDVLRERMKARVRERFGVELSAVRLVHRGALPRNSRGVPLRQRAKDKLLAGAFDEANASSGWQALASQWVRRFIK